MEILTTTMVILPQLYGSNATTAATQFYGTQGLAGQGKLRVYGESGTCNISGWFIGA